MRKKQKIRAADYSQEKKESIQCYFSLITEGKSSTWVAATGYSMLPLFWPGCKVRVNTRFSSLDIGQVVLFIQGRKVVAHRIVQKDDSGGYLTKGDTLCGFDRPLRIDEIVGYVDFVKRFRYVTAVGCDPALAALSLYLGDTIQMHMGNIPVIIQKIFYFTCFIPSFLWLQLTGRKIFMDKQGG